MSPLPPVVRCELSAETCFALAQSLEDLRGAEDAFLARRTLDSAAEYLSMLEIHRLVAEEAHAEARILRAS